MDTNIQSQPLTYRALHAVSRQLSQSLRPWAFPDFSVFTHMVRATVYPPHFTTERLRHQFYQGLVIVQGPVSLMTAWQMQPLETGSIALLSPGTLHQWQTSEEPCLLLSLDFDMNQPLITTSNVRLPYAPEHLETLEALCEVVTAHKPGWATRAHCHLGILYSYFLRFPDDASPANPRQTLPLAGQIDEVLRQANPATPLSLEMIAEQLSMSVRHLTRCYKAQTGCTIHARLEAFRLEYAAKLLSTSDLPVTEIARLVGLANTPYFTRRFHRRFGIAPRHFRLKAYNADDSDADGIRE